MGTRGKKWGIVGHIGAISLLFLDESGLFANECSIFGAIMFLGEHRHTIDEKGRLTIPAKYRGLLANGMVITRGLDRNLMAFSMAGWDELAARVKSLPWADSSAREFRRRIFSGATDVVPDKQGRVLLPAYLREFANIDSDVVIAGMQDHLEIWSSDSWEPVRMLAESDEQHWDRLGI